MILNYMPNLRRSLFIGTLFCSSFDLNCSNDLFGHLSAVHRYYLSELYKVIHRLVILYLFPVAINGSYPNQKMSGFMLVAVPLHARDETTAMGTFQVCLLPPYKKSRLHVSTLGTMRIYGTSSICLEWLYFGISSFIIWLGHSCACNNLL